MRKLMQKRQSMFAGRFRTGALVFAVAGMFSLPAFAQDPAQDLVARNYPSRPRKMIVAYTVGGGTDIMARLAAKELSQAFGQIGRAHV